MSSFSFSRKVAFRYLWSKRSEAFITILTVISVIGVALGVMALIITMAIMEGFEHEMREKLIGTNSAIVVKRLGGKIDNWRTVQETVAGIEGVESVSPFTLSQVLLRSDERSSGILIRGLEPGSASAAQLQGFLEDDQKIENAFNPPPITVIDPDNNEVLANLPGLVIGRELADQLNLLLGQPVSLLSPSVSSTPFGLMPRFKRFVISATYSSGLTEYESGLAYMALAEAQNFFRLGDTVNGFEVRVRDLDRSSIVAQKINGELSKLAPGFYAQDWKETNRPLWEAMQLERTVYFLVLLLIILVASFSIISTLVMIVLEKRKDIAILKTMGATSGSIARIFQIQGTIIGAFGISLGLLAGYFGCVGLQRYGFPLPSAFPMSTLPVRMEPFIFLVTGGAAFCICALATIYPALRASRLDPVEVLRYE
ncbi:MAG: ABC transporter permease [Deltaproteobacteria bacterium]|nr:ABC transporter permease [Deltaproteobacteria bacterium]